MVSDQFYINVPSALQDALEEVPDTTTLYSLDEDLTPRPVPGREGERYIPFGFDDRLPFKLMDIIGGDEVTAENKLFNVLTCYGAGISLQNHKTGQPVTDPKIEDWVRRQSLPTFFLEQITDMKYYYFSVCVIILNKARTQINRIVHKEACYCRLAPADRHGQIPYIYYGRFGSRTQAGEIERIPLLDITDPYGDLLRRTGREGHRSERCCKYAMLVRFPTAGCQYYPVPYWTSILRGGSYDEKRLISEGKRSKLRKNTSLKYHIEVERGYYERICEEEGITDPEAMAERIRKEKRNIEKYVCGLGNSGRTLISKYYTDAFGHEQRDVRIHVVETAKEGGEWSEDVQAAANTICYADNVHPNLVGAVPGKTQTNNSGSDKRELFTMKQALEIAFHDILLLPLQVACWFNGWKDVKPVVPMIQLTTLDQHKDAVETTPEEMNK